MHHSLRKMIFPAVILTLIGVCSYSFFLSSPKLDWDKSPKTLVVYTGIGVRHIDYNAIPDFQLWGDGRVIWVSYLSTGQRKVFEGHASEKEILTILEKLKDAGLFRARFPFAPGADQPCGYPGADAFLYIHLVRNSYSANTWTNTREICDAIHALVTGTEIAGQAYVPAEGKIYFVPLEKTDLPRDTQAVYQWSDADFPFRPETILAADKNGMVIMGQELKLAWEIVNRSSQPVVVSNGKKFWLAVTIQGISTVY